MKRDKLTSEEIDALGSVVERKVVLLYEMAAAMDVLAANIDMELKRKGYEFQREKKRFFGNYARCMKEAAVWFDKINIEGVIWKAAKQNVRRYDNYLADTREILRMLMLYVDRSHNIGGYEAIFKCLRSLPSVGIFPDDVVAEFDFERPEFLQMGDRVETTFGSGRVAGKGNEGNWVIVLDSGEQKIINERDIDF